MTVVIVLPWLWIGKDDSAIFPHASNDMLGLLVVFSVLTLLSAYFVRRMGRGVTKFAVMTDLGVVLALLGFVLQGLYAFNPQIFSGKISASSEHQLWVVGSIFVVCQVLYYLIAKLPLLAAVPLVALLTTAISYWLQIIASLIGAVGEYAAYLSYAGPVVLGLVLGSLGFLRAANLLIWLLALAIQWIMPAVFTALAGLGSSKKAGFGAGLESFTDQVASNLSFSGLQGPSLATLAVAMLSSVVLLIVHKVKRRSH